MHHIYRLGAGRRRVRGPQAFAASRSPTKARARLVTGAVYLSLGLAFGGWVW